MFVYHSIVYVLAMGFPCRSSEDTGKRVITPGLVQAVFHPHIYIIMYTYVYIIMYTYVYIHTQLKFWKSIFIKVVSLTLLCIILTHCSQSIWLKTRCDDSLMDYEHLHTDP